jgi:predicted  nucleic acid-binding Zn-ribbon protein
MDSEQGLGKKILSFFINDADRTIKAVSSPDKSTAVKQEVTTPVASNIVQKEDVAQKFIQHFVNLLEKENLPGPDYFEYKQALKSMESLGLTQEKLFQAAWASFKAMAGQQDTGVLTTSASQYLAALDKDRTAFMKDAEKALTDRLGSLRNEHKKLEEDNVGMNRQMADLKKRIDDNNNRLGQISGEITEQSTKINQNKENFDLTYALFTEQIKADLNHINTHLK